jgi:hypothetical protein
MGCGGHDGDSQGGTNNVEIWKEEVMGGYVCIQGGRLICQVTVAAQCHTIK